MEVELRHVTKTYLQGSNRVRGIEDVSLQIKEGTMSAIYGESGCGKSTLFHLMAGLLKPEHGEIVVDGNVLAKQTDRWIAHYRNQTVGYIMQGGSLVSHLSVGENLLLPYLFSLNKKVKTIAPFNSKRRIEEVLDAVHLKGYENQYPGQLSGGEQNRIQIARALLLRPKLILADEPTNGLDRENARNIIKILHRIARQGTTVVVSTHQTEYEKEFDFIYPISNPK